MKIVVFTTPIRPWRQPRTLRTDLTVILEDGSVCATWAQDAILLGDSRRIPVSDDLAEQVLGASRGPCSFNGTSPDTHFLAAGYVARDALGFFSDEPAMRAHCTECGYRIRYYPEGDGLSVHPDRTRLAGPRSVSTIFEADWDESRGELAPAVAEGELAIMIKHLGTPRYTIVPTLPTVPVPTRSRLI